MLPGDGSLSGEGRGEGGSVRGVCVASGIGMERKLYERVTRRGGLFGGSGVG